MQENLFENTPSNSEAHVHFSADNLWLRNVTKPTNTKYAVKMFRWPGHCTDALHSSDLWLLLNIYALNY